jgi:hypothetical protein
MQALGQPPVGRVGQRRIAAFATGALTVERRLDPAASRSSIGSSIGASRTALHGKGQSEAGDGLGGEELRHGRDDVDRQVLTLA